MSELILGICIGIGVPYIVFIAIIARGYFCPDACTRRTIISINIPAQMIVERELSPLALKNFKEGNLTIRLHNEIIYLYAIKGGNIHAYINYAIQLKHNNLLQFLRDPIRHPIIISRLMQQQQHQQQQNIV